MRRRTMALALALAALVAVSAGAGETRNAEESQWSEVEVPGSPRLWDVAVEGATVWLGTQGEGLVGYDGVSWVSHKEADEGIRQDLSLIHI